LKEIAQGWHGFLHLTLQEYFVAEYIIDRDQLKTLLSYRANPWWEEVLQLYAGSVSNASLLLRKLLALAEEDNIQEESSTQISLLAGQCLAA
jgi:predicted NACHT family NTPase